MALLDQVLHDRNNHGTCMQYDTSGGVVCLRCLFEALSSDSMLVSRRMYLLRRFAELDAPGATDAQGAVLADVCAQYPDYLLDHLMTAMAVAVDPSLSAALQELCLRMCSVASFFQDALAERLLAALADPQLWVRKQAAAPNSCSPAAVYLQLLNALSQQAQHSSSGLLEAVSSSQQLLQSVLQGISCASASVRLPTLQLLSGLLPAGAGNLPQSAQASLFLQLSEVLGLLTAPEEQLLCLSCLQHLTDQAGMQVLEHMRSPGSKPGLSAAGNNLMQGLRHVLLTGQLPVQLAGVQLVASMGSSAAASPNLLQGMLQADLCEYLVEVLSFTLQEQRQIQQQQVQGARSSGSQPSQAQAGTWQPGQLGRPGVGSAGEVANASARSDMCEGIQLAAVLAMTRFSTQGEEFLLHLQFGMETLSSLITAAAGSSNQQLLAASLNLVAEAAGSSAAETWFSMLPTSVLLQSTKAIAASLLELPENSAAATGDLLPSGDMAAAHIMACRLLEWICRHAVSKPGAWLAVETTLMQAGLSAAAALCMLHTSALLQGYLGTCCSLLQQLGSSMLQQSQAAAPQQQQQQHQPGPRNQLAARLLKTAKQKESATVSADSSSAPEDHLFLLVSAAADSVLPAISRLLTVVIDRQQATSLNKSANEALLPALSCLDTLLQSGHQWPSLQGAARGLVELMLTNHAWLDTSLQLLSAVLEGPARVAAWQLLMMMMDTTDGWQWLSGVQASPEVLAMQLDQLVPHPDQLLSTLLSGSQHAHTAHPSLASSQQPTRRCWPGRQGSCCFSEEQLAILALLAACVQCNCLCWPHVDVLMALNELVQQHRTALQGQADLLLRVVQLYSAVEQQACAAYQRGSALQHAALQLDDATADILSAAPEHLMAALLHATDIRLAPSSDVSCWVLSKVTCAPAVVYKLLQTWVQELLGVPEGHHPQQPHQQQQLDPEASTQGSSEQLATAGLDPDILRQAQQHLQQVVQVVAGAPDAIGLVLEGCAAAQLPQEQQIWLSIATALLHSSCSAGNAVTSCRSAEPSGSNSSWLPLTRRLLLQNISRLGEIQAPMYALLCCAQFFQGYAAAMLNAARDLQSGEADLSSLVQQVQMLVSAVSGLGPGNHPLQQHLELTTLAAVNALHQAATALSKTRSGTGAGLQMLPHLLSMECAQFAASRSAAACRRPPAPNRDACHNRGDAGHTAGGTQSLVHALQCSLLEALLAATACPGAHQLAPVPGEQLLAVALQWHYNCTTAVLLGQVQATQDALLPVVSPLCSSLLQLGVADASATTAMAAGSSQGAAYEHSEQVAVFRLTMADLLVLAEATRGSPASPHLLRCMWAVLLLLLRVHEAQGGAQAGGAAEALQHSNFPQQSCAGVATDAAARPQPLIGEDSVRLAIYMLQNMASAPSRGGGGPNLADCLQPFAQCCLAALVQLASPSSSGSSWALIGADSKQHILGCSWQHQLLQAAAGHLCSNLAQMQLLIEGGSAGQGSGLELLGLCQQVCVDGYWLLTGLLAPQQPEAAAGASSAAAGKQTATWRAQPQLGGTAANAASEVLQHQPLLHLLCWAVGQGASAAHTYQQHDQQQHMALPAEPPAYFTQAATVLLSAAGVTAARLLLAMFQRGLLQPHRQLLRHSLAALEQGQVLLPDAVVSELADAVMLQHMVTACQVEKGADATSRATAHLHSMADLGMVCQLLGSSSSEQLAEMAVGEVRSLGEMLANSFAAD